MIRNSIKVLITQYAKLNEENHVLSAKVDVLNSKIQSLSDIKEFKANYSQTEEVIKQEG